MLSAYFLVLSLSVLFSSLRSSFSFSSATQRKKIPCRWRFAALQKENTSMYISIILIIVEAIFHMMTGDPLWPLTPFANTSYLSLPCETNESYTYQINNDCQFSDTQLLCLPPAALACLSDCLWHMSVFFWCFFLCLSVSISQFTQPCLIITWHRCDVTIWSRGASMTSPQP